MRSNPVRDSRRTRIVSPCSAAMGAGASFHCKPSVKWPWRFLTSWSNPLADLWRRYLEQQIELGGAEVVVSGAAGKRVGGAVATEADGSNRVVKADPPTSVPAYPRSWRKGAPPIPGPGMAIETPGHVLGD